MEIQLIRNATMKITYAGKIFLTDPMLSPKDEFNYFAGKSTKEQDLAKQKLLAKIAKLTKKLLTVQF